MKNETRAEVKVRITWRDGYSVFGIAPGRVWLEEVPTGSRGTVATPHNATIGNFVVSNGVNSFFDRDHHSYYYRIHDGAVTIVQPARASFWWNSLPR